MYVRTLTKEARRINSTLHEHEQLAAELLTIRSVLSKARRLIAEHTGWRRVAWLNRLVTERVLEGVADIKGKRNSFVRAADVYDDQH